MNLFTGNSPYEHLLKYLIFLLKHPVYPTICNVTQFIYVPETALHVSGVTYTHHQECIQLYLQHLVFVTPLLLPAAIVEELELV